MHRIAPFVLLFISTGGNPPLTNVGKGSHVSFTAVGSSPSANGATVSNNAITLQPADATHPGLITSGTQALGGDKTLTGSITLTPAGAAGLTLQGGSSSVIWSPTQLLEIRLDNSNTQGLLVTEQVSGIQFIQIDSTTPKSVEFKTNVAYPFPATMTPSGTTQTIDWSTGVNQKLSLASASGDVTLTFSNPSPGAYYRILVVQGNGSRNVIWPTVKWPGGTAPVITTANGKIDKINFLYDGTSYYGTFSQNY